MPRSFDCPAGIFTPPTGVLNANFVLIFNFLRFLGDVCSYLYLSLLAGACYDAAAMLSVNSRFISESLKTTCQDPKTTFSCQVKYFNDRTQWGYIVGTTFQARTDSERFKLFDPESLAHIQTGVLLQIGASYTSRAG